MATQIYSKSDFPSYLPKLSFLYDDLFSGGKGFRSKLIQLICRHTKNVESTEQLLAQTVEFIHNASLLHDDLIDRSHLRRGKPAAWLKYSPEYAVLAGDYLLARVMVNLSHFGNVKLIQYTAEVISDLLEGEWLQDSLVGDFNVALLDLDRVHNLKTASLFKWCLRAPFLAAGRYTPDLHQELEEIGTLLGQLFQRGDDLLDFDVRNDEKKILMGDLLSGYVNSFCAFATKDLARREPSLRAVKSLDDFIGAVGGPASFRASVQRFDEINQQLIYLYEHRVQGLAHFFEKDVGSVVADLFPLARVLYFRNSK